VKRMDTFECEGMLVQVERPADNHRMDDLERDKKMDKLTSKLTGDAIHTVMLLLFSQPYIKIETSRVGQRCVNTEMQQYTRAWSAMQYSEHQYSVASIHTSIVDQRCIRPIILWHTPIGLLFTSHLFPYL